MLPENFGCNYVVLLLYLDSHSPCFLPPPPDILIKLVRLGCIQENKVQYEGRKANFVMVNTVAPMKIVL